MSYIPDPVLRRLREAVDLPDFSGTRYEMEHEIGRGGMGTIYAAMDTQLGRRVAIKILEEGEEAKVIAGLEHPGIVPVHDAGVLPDGRFYYAMKLVEGMRLDEVAKGEAGIPERLRLFEKICETVSFAHSRGVIHRDLKPENIMVGAFGEALIMDWGAGAVVGTPAYMPPEGGPATVLSDVYALGMVLKSLLMAGPPKALSAIASKAMAARPEDRYAGVVEMADDIAKFLDSQAVSAYRENAAEKVARWASRNSVLLLLILAYFVVRLALVFLRFV